MHKKNILVFTTSYFPFIGGAEIAVQEAAKRMHGKFNFYIITARQRRDLLRWEIVPEGTVIRVGFGMWLDTLLLPFLGVYAVMRLARSGVIEKPLHRSSASSTLLWGMDISQGSLAACLLKILFPRIPFVLTVQYGYGDDRIKKGRMGAIGIAFRRMLNAADAVTAISTYLFDMAHTYGYAGVGKVIPNGVDTALFDFAYTTDKKKKETEKDQYAGIATAALISQERRWNRKSGAGIARAVRNRKKPEETVRNRVLITTSRLIEKNAVDILIRAVAEVKKTIPQIKCYIIGDGPERKRLEKIAADLNIRQNIIFLGNIPYTEIPFYLKKADIFVRPSRTEGMGNSFIEALSVGIPVIGTAVGGIPDIIEDKKTGLFCNVDDPNDLAQKILLLFDDEYLVMAMRKNCRRLVEEKFSWDAIARSYEMLFFSLLDARLRVLVATPLYPPEIGGPATYSKALVDGMLNNAMLVRLARFSEVRHLPKIMRHWAYAWRVAWKSRYADVIYAQDPVSVGFPAALAAFVARKKFILKMVGDYAWEQGVQRFGVTELLDDFLKKPYGKKIEFLRSIEKFVARRAKRIVVPSNYLKHIVMQWGIRHEKITVIYNSFEIPHVIRSYEEARSMLGLNGCVIVSAGRMVPWKGFELLIDVIADVAQEIPDVQLIIIGTGPFRNKLQAKVARMGMQSHIKFTEHVGHDELLTYLAASDVFVLNTGYEGFSHVILEAMAMGTPVVTTAVGGNPELVTGESGFLVAYNNREELRQRVCDVLRMSRDEKCDMAAAARATAHAFTKDRMLKDTAALLHAL